MISYKCPKCGQSMSSPDSMGGQSETCKVCGNITIVPSQGSVASVPQRMPPLPPTSGTAPAKYPSVQPRSLYTRTSVESASRWRRLRYLVEERIQEELGPAETVVALVGARKGHIVWAIIVTLLLFPLTLLLIALLVIPGLIWLLYLGARDFGRIVRAGGSGASIVLTVVLSFFMGIIPGTAALMNWIVFPVFGIRSVFVAKTASSIVFVPFYNIFTTPTLSSVTVFPESNTGMRLIPVGSLQPRMILSRTMPYRELQIMKWGRDDQDQLRDLEILAAMSTQETPQ